jgi:hypothetical protein
MWCLPFSRAPGIPLCSPGNLSPPPHTCSLPEPLYWLMLLGVTQALLRELLIASEDKMTAMGGPEFVYIIAALAKLRAAPDQAWINR